MTKKDLVVTIPQTNSLRDVQTEMQTINRDKDTIGNHKIGKNRPKLMPIDILFVYKGKVRFKARFLRYEHKAFDCTTTGRKWEKAWYATFSSVQEIPASKQQSIKGFQGFRYQERGE